MRKIMFVGRSESGKTTIMQAMKGKPITYHLLEEMDKICYTYRVAVRPFPFKGKEHFMGKNLKGKDGGKGIYQRKDGLYSARFVDKTGKRIARPAKTTRFALTDPAGSTKACTVFTFQRVGDDALIALSLIHI